MRKGFSSESNDYIGHEPTYLGQVELPKRRLMYSRESLAAATQYTGTVTYRGSSVDKDTVQKNRLSVIHKHAVDKPTTYRSTQFGKSP
jgi:hypothetical protein